MMAFSRAVDCVPGISSNCQAKAPADISNARQMTASRNLRVFGRVSGVRASVFSLYIFCPIRPLGCKRFDGAFVSLYGRLVLQSDRDSRCCGEINPKPRTSEAHYSILRPSSTAVTDLWTTFTVPGKIDNRVHRVV